MSACKGICVILVPDLLNTSHWRIQGGRQGRAPPLGAQILSFSCSFQQKVEKIIPFWELAPPLRKILDPPLLQNKLTNQVNFLNILCYDFNRYCARLVSFSPAQALTAHKRSFVHCIAVSELFAGY